MIVINRKRCEIFLAVVFLIFSLLCTRLSYLALFKKGEYTDALNAQSTQRVSLGKKRGIIYDRNMIPLTDRKYQKKHIGALNSTFEDEGSIEISLPKRYDKTYPATHITGYYTNVSGGMWGMEKQFDHILSRDEEYVISYQSDGIGRPKKDVRIKKSFEKDTGSSLKLTLDYHIQTIAESVAKKHIEKGAVVIMDVESFDILAMVSRPDYDKNSIEAYLSGDGTELLNRCICQYNPGSIFKIVTSVCAIENLASPMNMTYNCQGSFTTSDGLSFPCNKAGGHGWVDMKSAFASSCNCYFYNLGTKLGAKAICETASRLGLGKAMLDLGAEEATGKLPEKSFYSGGDRANISIGQGDTLITPLQCVAMVSAVANSGIGKEINIADSVTDSCGKELLNLKNEGEYALMSESCAALIGEMMRECALSGTALQAGESKIPIAGKTGSAETGWLSDDGSLCVHGWFCGFFPYDSPEYAMVVFTENGKSGSQSCVLPFVEICEKINEIYPIKQ